MRALRTAAVTITVLLPVAAFAQDPVHQTIRAGESDTCVVSAPAGMTNDSMGAGAAFAAAVERCMAGMHRAMTAALTGNSGATDHGAHTVSASHGVISPERAFAEAMIPHHRGAIDMARFLLLYGDAPELRSFALKVIVEQQVEIDLLEQWIERAGTLPSAVPASSSRPASPPPLRAAQNSTAPAPFEPIPISPRDRVYTADQVSNTVSVIDPSSNRLLGRIVLGNPRPNVLSPLYEKQANVHGLGFSPDGSTLAVISTATNAVTFIDLATNEVKGTAYVGRNPHEGFWTPDGSELWVTIRGASYVSVIDPVAMKEIARVETAEGPGMVVFRPDGVVAFVDHSFTAELDVVDVDTRRVIERIPVVSPFSPNLAMTLDGREVWLTHKDVGKVSVVDAQTFEVIDVLDTGPVTNHVNFAGPNAAAGVGGATGGDFAYVTIGGENAVKVYRRSDRALIATIPVGAVPHGLWPSGDGTRIYAGLQQEDAVAVIDTRTNTKVAEIPIGQSPQALVYVPRALAEGAAGTANLVPLTTDRPLNVMLRPAPGAPAGVGGSATVRELGPVDGIEISLNGLDAGARYTVYVADRNTPPFGDPDPLATLEADADGKAAVDAYTSVRSRLTRPGMYLVVLAGDDPGGAAVLIQRNASAR